MGEDTHWGGRRTLVKTNNLSCTSNGQFCLLCVYVCVWFRGGQGENTLMPLGEAERVICECFRHLIPQNSLLVVILFFPCTTKGKFRQLL